MPLPSDYPSEDASFASIPFFELTSGGLYAAYTTEEEQTTVGQTIITRYTKPRSVQIAGLCGLAEANDFDSATGSGSLVWHRGSNSAVLIRAETRRIPSLGVAEITLSLLI